MQRKVLLWVGQDRTEEAVRVLHRGDGPAALPYSPDRMHVHVGGIRQPGADPCGEGA